MEAKKHIVLLVPDGTGIKNYLYSDTFKNVDATISLYHNFDADTLEQIEQNIKIEKYVELPKYSEGVREKFLRELIHYVRIKQNAQRAKNNTILSFWNSNYRTLKRKLFYGAVILRGKLVGSYKAVLKLEEHYEAAIRKTQFYQQVYNILKDQKPEVVFCTHQRALNVPAIFAAARDLGIPTSTVIYSWDNIPKARLTLKADTYFVWSAYMKEELQLFYPEINSESIKVTGTPQFEFYKDPQNIIEADTFYKEYKLDRSKYLICFSGDDELTSPHDPGYLYDLASSLQKSGMDANCQIIFRRCPVDVSGRYDEVVAKFPDLIIEIPPIWNYNSAIWSAVYPTFKDVRLLVSLAYYADVVINVGSTMAFDFGMFNKPCIFINYDRKTDPNWSVDTIYKFQHFRSMPSQKSVFWLNDPAEIAEVIQSTMNRPKTDINKWFEVVVAYPDTASSQIIKELL